MSLLPRNRRVSYSEFAKKQGISDGIFINISGHETVTLSFLIACYNNHRIKIDWIDEVEKLLKEVVLQDVDIKWVEDRAERLLNKLKEIRK